MQEVQTIPFDRAQMLERLGDDTDLLIDVLQVFQEECPRMLAEVRAALDQADAGLVRRAAHSMKGALLNISAAPAAAAAAALEELGREQRLEEGGPVIERLQHEVERLRQALAQHTDV
jgi:HPt (histidine-containing phosphotransfer) domain-containing protein